MLDALEPGPESASERRASKTPSDAVAQGPAKPDRLRQVDAEDHQGHADGRGLEAAPCAGGRRSGASLCGADGGGPDQSRRRGDRRRRRPRLLAGTGADQVHLLVVCTGERGLCGAFNTSIVRLARERASALIGAGQDGQDPSASAARATTSSAALMGSRSSRLSICAASHDRLRAMPIRSPKRSSRCSTRRVRRLHAVLLALQVGDRADPDRAADHPAAVRRRRPWRARGAAYEYEPEEEEILAELLPRNMSVQIFRALLENAASEQGARMSAMDNATRNAGEMIRKQTLHLQPHAPGDDHQGTDRDHLRRRGALTRIRRI